MQTDSCKMACNFIYHNNRKQIHFLTFLSFEFKSRTSKHIFNTLTVFNLRGPHSITIFIMKVRTKKRSELKTRVQVIMYNMTKIKKSKEYYPTVNATKLLSFTAVKCNITNDSIQMASRKYQEKIRDKNLSRFTFSNFIRYIKGNARLLWIRILVQLRPPHFYTSFIFSRTISLVIYFNNDQLF